MLVTAFTRPASELLRPRPALRPGLPGPLPVGTQVCCSARPAPASWLPAPLPWQPPHVSRLRSPSSLRAGATSERPWGLPVERGPQRPLEVPKPRRGLGLYQGRAGAQGQEGGARGQGATVGAPGQGACAPGSPCVSLAASWPLPCGVYAPGTEHCRVCWGPDLTQQMGVSGGDHGHSSCPGRSEASRPAHFIPGRPRHREGEQLVHSCTGCPPRWGRFSPRKQQRVRSQGGDE